jgi:hypothetical protein
VKRTLPKQVSTCARVVGRNYGWQVGSDISKQRRLYALSASGGKFFERVPAEQLPSCGQLALPPHKDLPLYVTKLVARNIDRPTVDQNDIMIVEERRPNAEIEKDSLLPSLVAKELQ